MTKSATSPAANMLAEPTRMDSRIIDDILVSDDGELFLTGGAHSPLEYGLGLRHAHPNSIANFYANLAARQGACKALGIPYVHMVAPDKQSVLREAFAVPDYRPLGERYRDVATALPFLYPVEELGSLQPTRSYLRTDAHWSIEGRVAMAGLLAHELGLPEDSLTEGAAVIAAGIVPKDAPHSGDLGRKLTPPVFEQINIWSPEFPSTEYVMSAGNNRGTMRYVISTRPGSTRRLLMFGDSFGAGLLTPLSAYFGEVVFCRTEYFHPEIVAGVRPDCVVTQNAERYLTKVKSDSSAPPLLLYPATLGRSYSCTQATAQAMAAVLSSGSPAHSRFLASVRATPATARTASSNEDDF
jgi:hypothetical protein